MKGPPAMREGSLRSKPTWSNTSRYSTTSAFFVPSAEDSANNLMSKLDSSGIELSILGYQLGKGNPTGKLHTPPNMGRLVMRTSRDYVPATLADSLAQQGDCHVRCLSSVQEMAVVIDAVVAVMAELGY